jgi:MtN3 and saliva related transmembrane protein
MTNVRFINFEAFGLAAATLSTVAFLPQVIHTWRQGGQGLSYLMLALLLAGTSLWLVYGAALGSQPIILANAVTALQALIILFLKLRRIGNREERK